MMRKRLGWLGTGLACLLLAGCAAVPMARRYEETVRTAAAQTYSFTGTMTLEGQEQPVVLQCTKSCDGMTLELLEPPEVAGMQLHFGGETTRLEYRELVMNLLPDDIPETSVFVALAQLLPVMAEAPAQEQDGQVLLSGTVGSTGYKALWQGEPATLLRLEIPTAGAVIQVSKFNLSQ